MEKKNLKDLFKQSEKLMDKRINEVKTGKVVVKNEKEVSSIIDKIESSLYKIDESNEEEIKKEIDHYHSQLKEELEEEDEDDDFNDEAYGQESFIEGFDDEEIEDVINAIENVKKDSIEITFNEQIEKEEEEIDLESLRYVDLFDIAKANNFKGWSQLTKANLIQFLIDNGIKNANHKINDAIKPEEEEKSLPKPKINKKLISKLKMEELKEKYPNTDNYKDYKIPNIAKRQIERYKQKQKLSPDRFDFYEEEIRKILEYEKIKGNMI